MELSEVGPLDAVGLAVVFMLLFGVGTAVLAGAQGPAADAPAAGNWSFERLDANSVRITYAAGQPIPASEVVVTAGGVERQAEWPDPIRNGDSVVVPAIEGKVVEVHLVVDRGELQSVATWSDDRAGS